MEPDPGTEALAPQWPVVPTLDPVTLLNELRSREQASNRAQQRLTALLEAVMAVTADLELADVLTRICLLYTSPSPRDGLLSRMPSSA